MDIRLTRSHIPNANPFFSDDSISYIVEDKESITSLI